MDVTGWFRTRYRDPAITSAPTIFRGSERNGASRGGCGRIDDRRIGGGYEFLFGQYKEGYPCEDYETALTAIWDGYRARPRCHPRDTLSLRTHGGWFNKNVKYKVAGRGTDVLGNK